MKFLIMLLTIVMLACSTFPQAEEPEQEIDQVIEINETEISLTKQIENDVILNRERTRIEEERILEVESRLEELTNGIIQIQPWYSSRPRDAVRLARIISNASDEHNIDPWISIAIARRESSLLNGLVGSLGEVGMFQVMPFGAAKSRCSNGCDLTQPRCSAHTAACWLNHCREHCGDDTWVWVAAYGTSKCPSPSAARNQLQARRARSFLVELIGEEEANERWPL